jgi:riboflavin biosynthesis pyrimidine reductase
LADLDRGLRAADEPDPESRLHATSAAILKAANTTTALKDARANAGTEPPKMLQPGAESWAAAYVATGDLAEEIAKLKAGDGKPIVAHGGAGFARSLIATGLIDEYALLVHPFALGKGLPIFSDLAAPRPLKLISSKSFPQGAIATIYRPA